MQLSIKFTALTSAILFAIAANSHVALVDTDASTTNTVDAPESEPSIPLMTRAQMMHWLATTDANLTFIGESINPLAPLAAQNTIVTFCSTRINSLCAGPCSVYNGGAACLAAPNTNCLAATGDVGFCAGKKCDGGCNILKTCGVHLDNGFCFTPNTNSISVPS